jgi:hypothetical protein
MAKWFIQRNGKQAGPFESAQLKQLAAEGKIRPEDQIRRDDQDKWHNAEKVKGLFEPVAKPPDTVNKEPLPATAEWLRHVNGQETGPMSFLDVCEKFRSGEIGATDFIAQRSMKWVQAGDFLEPAVLENATSADEWFITSGEEVKGPFPFLSLLEMHKAKQLSEADLIGRKGSKGHRLGFLFVDQASKSPNRLLPILILIILFGGYRYYASSGSSEASTETKNSNAQAAGKDGDWRSVKVGGGLFGESIVVRWDSWTEAKLSNFEFETGGFLDKITFIQDGGERGVFQRDFKYFAYDKNDVLIRSGVVIASGRSKRVRCEFFVPSETVRIDLN